MQSVRCLSYRLLLAKFDLEHFRWGYVLDRSVARGMGFMRRVDNWGRASLYIFDIYIDCINSDCLIDMVINIILSVTVCEALAVSLNVSFLVFQAVCLAVSVAVSLSVAVALSQWHACCCTLI